MMAKTPVKKTTNPTVKKEKVALKRLAKNTAAKSTTPRRPKRAAPIRSAVRSTKQRIRARVADDPRVAEGKIPLIEGSLSIFKDPSQKNVWKAERAPRPNERRRQLKTLDAVTMDGAIIEAMNLFYEDGFGRKSRRISEQRAMAAVRDLISWTGDNPDREGLHGTPDRVIRAYREWFAGYEANPDEILSTTFSETGNYKEMISLTDIPFESHCEHHMTPFVGKAHIAYMPEQRVVGISKLARLVDVFAKRLQIQEKMTAQIADTLQISLVPKGVGVVIEGTHMCMTTRGVKKPNVIMRTSCLHGCFDEDTKVRDEFFRMIDSKA